MPTNPTSHLVVRQSGPVDVARRLPDPLVRRTISRLAVLALVLLSACRGSAHRDSRSPAELPSSPVLTGPEATSLEGRHSAREVPHAALDAGVVSDRGFDAGSAATVVTVSLRVDANGGARTWVDSDPPEILPFRVDATSFAAVAANAKKRAATQVIIALDSRATHSHVVGLIDALQKVGLTTIAIQLVP